MTALPLVTKVQHVKSLRAMGGMSKTKKAEPFLLARQIVHVLEQKLGSGSSSGRDGTGGAFRGRARSGIP